MNLSSSTRRVAACASPAVKRTASAFGLLVLLGTANICSADLLSSVPPPPSQLYGDLFVAVQTQQVFPDQKTFVDATPTSDPAAIVQLY